MNYVLHLIFPARNFLKDIAYWSTEILAAIIVLIYLISSKTNEAGIRDNDGSIYYFTTWSGMTDEEKIEFNKTYQAASSYEKLNMDNHEYQSQPGHFQNNEYGWVALIYCIKHLIYLVDTIFLKKKGHCKIIDFFGPALNAFMWGTYALWGFLYKYGEITMGIAFRFQIDSLTYIETYKNDVDPNYDTDEDRLRAEFEKYKADYFDPLYKWKALFVVPALIFLIQTGLWIWSLKQKRSSAFSNLSASVVLVSLQMTFFSLFHSLLFIHANNYESLKYKTAHPNPSAEEKASQDKFEARWVFCIVYVGAWIAAFFSVVCWIRAFADFKHKKNYISGTKWILYGLFCIDGLLFCLCMDDLLWAAAKVTYLKEATLTLIVGIVLAIAIGILSIIQKRREGNFFYERHLSFDKWMKGEKVYIDK